MYFAIRQFQPYNVPNGVSMSIVLSESSIFIGSKPMAIQQISSGHPGYTIVNVYNLESQIKNYSKFFDLDKIFLVDNPNNDQIKTIGQLNNNQYHLFFDDESFDGRNSFISKIKKSGRIYDYSFPMFGDVQSLKRCCYKEIKSLNVKIDQPCYEWIISNCPTFRIKSKTAGTKKEKIVYDLDLLFQELRKLASVKSEIKLEDIENSLFDNDTDIFEFIDHLINKNEDVYDTCNNLCSAIGEQGLLLILLSQLYFLLVVSDCKEKNIYDANKVADILECKDLLGKYLGENWFPSEFTIKTQNPIRIKIQMNKTTPPVTKIAYMIEQVVNTIKDLRNSGSKNHSLFLMINKILSV